MSDSPMQQRRRTAAILRDIIREVVTVDVDDAELAAVADALEPLRDRLAAERRIERDVSGLHMKDHVERLHGQTPLYDRDPLIGLSNPLSPPVERVAG